MRKKINFIVKSLIIAIIGCGVWFVSQQTAQRVESSEQRIVNQQTNNQTKTKEEPRRDFGKLPMSFEKNQGQADESVRFLSRGTNYNLYLTDNKAVLSLYKKADEAENSPSSATFQMSLADSNSSPEISSFDELEGKVNYIIGQNPENWKTGVSTFGKVKYTGVYEGIDLVYYGNQSELEYDFIVAPNANPNDIKIQFEGAEEISIDEQSGELVLKTATGEVRQHAPVIYQEINGERKNIQGHYKLIETEQIENQKSKIKNLVVGFEIGEYDQNQPLVIDPILIYSTYLGGSDAFSTANDGTVARGDIGYSVAVDENGFSYIAGAAHSTDFPLANATQLQCRTNTPTNSNFVCVEAFVTKFDQTRTGLIYSTYLGGLRTVDGLGIDIAKSIAVDAGGNAYITGFTNSPDYPTTVGSYQRFFPCLAGGNAGGCSFVTKLSASGVLVYSTFLGGNASPGIAYEGATGIAIDGSGNAYVVGRTQTTSFPVRNGYRTRCDAPRPSTPFMFCDGSYGFLTKFNAAGSDLLYSTFIGGEPKTGAAISPIVAANDVAVDNQGNAYIVGSTNSNWTVRRPLPGQGTFRSNPANCTLYFTQCLDGFVMKINTNATGAASLSFSTFLGGENYDEADGVAIDSAKNIYVTGYTNSLNFPVTPNADDNFCGNLTPCTANAIDRTDAFVTKIKADYSGYVYSTFVGGDLSETIAKIAVDSAGYAYITGSTNSTDFPTTANALQQTLGGAVLAGYVAKFNPTGARDFSTYLRGTLSTEANSYTLGTDIFVDAGGNAHITGGTTSHEFPVANPIQFRNRAQNDTLLSVFGYNAFYTVIGDPTPIVFIPGVAGSVLNDQSSGNLERWIGIGTDHRHLTLNPDSPFYRGGAIYASDALRDVIPTVPALREPLYGPLLESLRLDGGFVEYNVNGDPLRRTVGGCDVLNQQSRGPSLFVLAYDWRRDNVITANQRLAEYVQCIEQFYGANTKINIISHSMGNFVARRYILDHPGKVKKHISIAPPWLGGPKIINVLATGQFFETFTEKVVVAGDETFRFLTEDFTAAHQILPSRSFFALGGRPYYEKDSNGNFKIYNNYDEFAERMNQLIPRTRPGDADRLFHDYPGQDDWRNDTSGVQYYNIYGVRSKDDTIGTVIKEPTKEVCVRLEGMLLCRAITTYQLLKVAGDGTVPRLSAERKRNGLNLNAPNARVVPFVAQNESMDKLVEHNGLTKNRSVQKAVLQFLNEPTPSNSPFSQGLESENSFAIPPVPLVPFYSVNFAGLRAVTVADDFGNTTAPLPDNPSFITTVPGVGYQKPDLDSVALTLPTGQNFTVTFTMPNQPIMLEWTKGTRKLTTDAGRYLDLNLPQNTPVRLTITTAGVQDLRYDSDNNGSFETLINPTAQTSGANANDKNAPLVSFSETAQGGMSNLSISAMDAGSGVNSVFYSTDNTNFQPYTAPLLLNSGQTVYAFSDDNAGNRSSTVTYQTGSFKLKINGNITDNNGGVADVVLNLTSAPNTAVTTQSVEGGIYNLGGLTAGNSYTLTPENPYYTFSPPSVSLSNLTQSATVNFTATRKTYNISGRVTNQNGNGAADVMLTLTGGQTAMTNSSGNYTFANLAAGEDYVVTASKPFFDFKEPALQIIELDTNETVDFSGTEKRFGISGRITNVDGNGFARVNVMLSNGSQTFTTQTDASGFYFFDELAGGANYTVTPSKPSAVFTPQNQTFNNLSSDLNGDFTSPTSPNTWTGELSTDWFNPDNWVGGAVPPSEANVIVPSGALNEIIIGSNDVQIAGLTLQTGRTLTINNGRILNVTNDAVINGVLNGQGTFNCNGTATFAGTVPQTVPGGNLNNLTVNNSAGISLLGNVTVNGQLTLTTDINTGNFALIQPDTAPLSNGNGDVVGNSKRTGLGGGGNRRNSNALNTVYSFGNQNNQITFTNGTPPDDVTINLTKTVPSNFGNAVRRTYVITPVGGNGYTATLRLRYLDSELNNNNEATLQLWRYSGTNWQMQGATSRDLTENWVERTGVTSFSPWTISGPLAPTAATASVSGKVMDLVGKGIYRASVDVLNTATGQEFHAVTDKNGRYNVNGLRTGNTYIVSVRYKTLQFTPQVVTVQDDVADLDFRASP